MDFSNLHRSLEESVESFARNSPRFGYSNQFADLFDEDPQKTTEYILGVCVVALILAVIFLCWFFSLLVFKCMGQKRVGFLSGAPYEDPTGTSTRLKAGRMGFGLGGLLYFTFTFTLMFMGFQNLEYTTGELAEGASLGQQIFRDVGELLGDFLKFAVKVGKVRDSVVDTLEDIFETNNTLLPENFTLPPDVEDVLEGINFTVPPEVEEAIGGAVEEVVDLFGTTEEDRFIFEYGNGEQINLKEEAAIVVRDLKSLDQFVDQGASALEAVVTDGDKKCGEVSDGLDSVQVTALQIGFGVPLLIVSSFMMALMGATALGYDNRTKTCLTSWLIMPLFLFILLFLIILTMAFTVAGIIDGDFCSGGESQTPEDTLRQIMQKSKVDSTTLQYKVVDYLINGCDLEAPTTENPIQFLNDFSQEIERATAELESFEQVLQEVGIVEITKRLAKNITGIYEEVDAMAGEFWEMFKVLEDIIAGLACIRIYDIYSKVVHDATCDKSYKGLVWTFVSFLVISFGGCLMVTFRAVLYPPSGGINKDNYLEEEGQEVELEKEHQIAMIEPNDGGSGDEHPQEAPMGTGPLPTSE